MPIEFTLTTFISATPREIYQAWLHGDLHTAMTGGSATGEPEEESEFSAWDGYISGKNIELVEDEKIVQKWRTTEFKATDSDSDLEILLKPTEGGSEVTLKHTNIPENQPDYEQGWRDHYFTPMKDYFSD